MSREVQVRFLREAGDEITPAYSPAVVLNNYKRRKRLHYA